VHQQKSKNWNRAASLGFALLVLQLGACASFTPQPPPVEGTVQYLVGAPDVLHLVILPEPVIERNLTVRPDGRITIDLIGDVKASGRTTDQIASDIQKRIARFKRDARVTLSVEAPRTDMITVFGEVNNPRAFPLERETRVAEAIGLVGGPTLYSAKNKIRVVRNHGAETQVLTVDLEAIEFGDLSSNFLLTGGDIVIVPPSVMGKISQTMQIIMAPLQPALGAAGSVTSVYGATRVGN